VSQAELAKRYAKAILEIGHQRGLAKDYVSQLQGVSQAIFNNNEALGFFANKMVPQESKRKALEALLGAIKCAEDVDAFLRLLVDRNRILVLAEIVKSAAALIDEEDGITRGRIKSSAPLSSESKADYEKKLGLALKRKIILETSVDQKVLGGVRIDVGGWTFDDSLESHLSHLGDQLLKQVPN
jgi:F-type H+-transporting ATPase subunit delta